MIKIVLWVFVFILIALGFYSIIRKKSHLLSSISFLFAVVIFFLSCIPQFTDFTNDNTATSESTFSPDSTFQQSETIIDNVVETDIIEESSPQITEKTEESRVEESALSYDNTIKGDCDLIGSFRNGLKEKYIWYPKYNNSYGLKFHISDVNLSYYVKIVNEKGETLYEYRIDDDGVTQNPLLDKSSEYTLWVEANKGTPEYKIEIRYPDNDDY